MRNRYSWVHAPGAFWPFVVTVIFIIIVIFFVMKGPKKK